MKLFLTSLTLMIISAISGFGQDASDKMNACTNLTAESISSRGVKLGMSQGDVLNIFADNGKLTTLSGEYLPNEGRTRYTQNERDYQNLVDALQKRAAQVFGFSSTILVPKNIVKFNGIARYDFGFLDNRLAFFNVYYTKPKWENREQFIRKLSEILGLPILDNHFNINPYGLKCGDYKIDFGQSNEGNEFSYTMLVSANIDEIIRQRQKKFEDEQREKDIKIFKP